MAQRVHRARAPRRFALTAAFALTGLALAACAPSGADSAASGGNGANGANGGNEATGEAVVSEDVLAELQSEVDEAKAQPTWEAPGPSFSVADLAGQKILSMPVTSQLEGCDRMARTVVDIANDTGMTGSTYFQNNGGTEAWVQGMNLAINQGYDGVALVCGIDPAGLAPQMEAAREAGIEVVVLHLGDEEDEPSDLIAAQTHGQFNRSMRMGVAQAFLDNEGRPFDALMITSNENPPSVGMERTVNEEFERLCGDECQVQSINVPIPEWATGMTSAVSSALVANPDIRAVFMAYDGATPFVLPAIQASNVDALTYAFGADPTFVQLMEDPENPMGSDMGPNFDWMAYTGTDQLFRVMTGTDPVDTAVSPYRMWTPENVDELQPPDWGFGDEFREGYEGLWEDAPTS